MQKALWILALLSAVAGGLYDAFNPIIQAQLGIAMAVIPYCVAHSYQEFRRNRDDV